MSLPAIRRRPSLVVLVTGVPGAGKTTLGARLAEALGVRFVSLDSIKERLFAEDPDGWDAQELRFAAEAELGELLAASDDGVVVDIWVSPHRDEERVRALLRARCVDVVEVLCRVPASVAVQRYLHRPRTGPHQPADASTLERIRRAVEEIEPLGLGTTVEVDTSGPVSLCVVLSAIRRR